MNVCDYVCILANNCYPFHTMIHFYSLFSQKDHTCIRVNNLIWSHVVYCKLHVLSLTYRRPNTSAI